MRTQNEAFPNAALPAKEDIAELADRHSACHLAFNHARLLALCADNRGLNVRAFEDCQEADDWLHAALPTDPKKISATLVA